jgi:hypothetical protein
VTSAPSVAAFVVIPLILLAVFAYGVKRVSGLRSALLASLVAALWMTVTWLLADSGALRAFERRPPPFLLLPIAILGLAFVIAFSRLGHRLATGIPIYALIAVQSFRFPLELAMHDLMERGIMPIQMSYSGRNFDILTGITAIAVAFAVKRGIAGKKLILAWNIMGLILLVNIVTVAILSTPLFRYFGNDRLNVFVTYPPFVWLPAVLVLAALAGHLLIFRALKSQSEHTNRPHHQ